ncbi:MAG: GerMN domain-containing protein [Lachnospiraceae bacterium]|nr:GerMN domain-containing protein [Lachnospiraceae bacterium]
MKRIRSFLILAAVLWIGILTVGCGKQKPEETGVPVELYYLNMSETKVVMEEYRLQADEPAAAVDELLVRLSEQPKDQTLKPAIGGSVHVMEYGLEEGQLILKFDEHYKELSATTEVLTRAAIVRTLTQIPGVDYVSMQIREENLTDAAGNPVGVMSADMFIDNAGDEINAYEKTKLRLYFADESGTKLIEAVRPKVYSSNISMEKLVVEELIHGPNNAEIYPTINPNTKVVSVTVKDGICYVNLDENFLVQPYQVSSEVTIFSIVNSLVELPNVNKVQLSINGNTDVMYREKISLTNIFERNLEIVGSL